MLPRALCTLRGVQKSEWLEAAVRSLLCAAVYLMPCTMARAGDGGGVPRGDIWEAPEGQRRGSHL